MVLWSVNVSVGIATVVPSRKMLGYALGHLAWEARRGSKKNAPAVAIGPGSVALVWDLH